MDCYRHQCYCVGFHILSLDIRVQPSILFLDCCPGYQRNLYPRTGIPKRHHSYGNDRNRHRFVPRLAPYVLILELENGEEDEAVCVFPVVSRLDVSLRLTIDKFDY